MSSPPLPSLSSQARVSNTVVPLAPGMRSQSVPVFPPTHTQVSVAHVHVVQQACTYVHIHVSPPCLVYTCACIYTHRKSDCLGCAVLLYLVVCLTLIASFFLPSLISHLKTCTYSFLPQDPLSSSGGERTDILEVLEGAGSSYLNQVQVQVQCTVCVGTFVQIGNIFL